MSTRIQKRKAIRREEEEETLEIQDQDMLRVRSVELGGSDTYEPCTSSFVPANQSVREFGELKTSLRKEIAE